MGEDRNSFSKTDTESTFMRMKDDHMMNGQLKPGYNLQFALENYFIVDTYISNDRTDYKTLIPVIEKHNKLTGVKLKEIIADSGYSSEANLNYLKKEKIIPYIKLQEHEIKKTKKYKTNIGKYYNMKEICEVNEKKELVYSYVCSNNKTLNYIKTETRNYDGISKHFEVYKCNDCSGCKLKSKCLYNYNEKKHKDKIKIMRINRNWDELKKVSEENIHTEKGIKYRQIRSVQAEGAFGNMKENHDFRKFNYRGAEKVHKKALLYAIGSNMKKYHRFKFGLIKKFDGKIA